MENLKFKMLLEENKKQKEALKYYQDMLFRSSNKQFTRDRREMYRICSKNGIPLFNVISGRVDKRSEKTKKEIALFFRNKGYTYRQIGELLNYKSHSPVINLIS